MSPFQPESNAATQSRPGVAAPLVIDDHAADVLFREAHTAYGFTDEPVSDHQLRAIHDLVKWAPTAMNGQPMRVTLVRSPQARERLLGHLAPMNRPKSASSPVVAILSYDLDFHTQLPYVMPQIPNAAEGFAQESAQHDFGSFNGALQAAYFLLGVRAVGLSAGPMGGFHRSGVDADFFPEGRQRSFLVVNIGHAAPDGTFPRNPRLDYDQVVTTV